MLLVSFLISLLRESCWRHTAHLIWSIHIHIFRLWLNPASISYATEHSGTIFDWHNNRFTLWKKLYMIKKLLNSPWRYRGLPSTSSRSTLKVHPCKAPVFQARRATALRSIDFLNIEATILYILLGQYSQATNYLLKAKQVRSTQTAFQDDFLRPNQTLPEDSILLSSLSIRFDNIWSCRRLVWAIASHRDIRISETT